MLELSTLVLQRFNDAFAATLNAPVLLRFKMLDLLRTTFVNTSADLLNHNFMLIASEFINCSIWIHIHEEQNTLYAIINLVKVVSIPFISICHLIALCCLFSSFLANKSTRFV